MSPTHQDLSNDTTFSQIKSRVPVPLSMQTQAINCYHKMRSVDWSEHAGNRERFGFGAKKKKTGHAQLSGLI